MALLLTLNKSALFVSAWITDLLQEAGLQVSPSFNLRTAVAADTPCTCPHHENDCDCDLAVLLVYGATPQPATLLVHSHNGRSWLSLEEQVSSELGVQIKSTLADAGFKSKTAVVG
jgi:hypothetical protein